MIVTHAGGSPHHGPNMRWYHLANALRAKRVAVEIVSASYFHKYFAPPEVTDNLTHEDIDSVPYHWIKTTVYAGGALSRLKNQVQFVHGCYHHTRALADPGIDYVVASSPHPLVVFPARRIAKLSGAKFIFEIRDLWPLILNEANGMSLNHPYAKLMGVAERYGVKHADLVMSVKPGDIDYLDEKYSLERSRFHYSPNGFLPGNRIAPAAPGIIDVCRGKKFVIGYVGGLSAVYELSHLIDTARRFQGDQDIAFVIAGKGDQDAELRAEAADLDNVYFSGPVPNTSVPAVLQQFDACYVGLRTMPMNKYGISSNKIYEYMHAGKPIVASYRIGHDPVQEVQCGLVSDPGDIDELEAAIRTLATDADLCADMGRRARAYFDAHHDFSTVADKLATEVFV